MSDPDDFGPEFGDAPEPTTNRRITPRAALLVGARTTSALVGAAIAVAVVLGAATITLPTWSVTPASVQVTPDAATERLICSGAPLRLADSSGAGASTPAAIKNPTRTIYGLSSTASNLPQSDAGTGGTDAAPLLVTAPPSADGVRLPAAAAQAVLVDEGDIRGLATETCSPPLNRQWLLGGSTAVGRSAILSISNPSAVMATVSLEIFTENGPVSGVGMEGIEVPAGTQRVVPISGFVLDAKATAISVTSTGGGVAASLQTATIRTLEPGGLDQGGSVPEPENSLVIPGLKIADAPALSTLLARGSGYSDADTVLRLLAPTEDAVATITVVPVGMTLPEAVAMAATDPVKYGGEGSESANVDLTTPRPRRFEAHLSAQRVIDIPLTNLATGTYTLHIDATSPVLAAARVTSVGAWGTDFAWLNSAASLGTTAGVAVPDAPSAFLHLVNSTDADTPVTLTAADGEVRLTIRAGSAIVVAVGDPALASVIPAGQLAGSSVAATPSSSNGAAVGTGGTTTGSTSGGTFPPSQAQQSTSGIAATFLFATFTISAPPGVSAAIGAGSAGLIAVSAVQPPPANARPVTVFP